MTAAKAAGNYVVLDFGRGRYALYAHLIPGSIRVAPGEEVLRGQVLGLAGNSGNSDAPHLHFHIMDGPDPLKSNGLPCVFKKYTIFGEVDLPDRSGGDRGDQQRRAAADQAHAAPAEPETRAAAGHGDRRLQVIQQIAGSPFTRRGADRKRNQSGCRVSGAWPAYFSAGLCAVCVVSA